MLDDDKIKGNEFTIIWKIENFSFCPQSRCMYLSSPEIVVDTLVNTCFFLRLYPRGIRNLGYIDCGFHSNWEDNRTKNISVKLAFLNDDGLLETWRKVSNKTVYQYVEVLFKDFFPRNALLERRSKILPNDTLTILCRIEIDRGEFMGTIQCVDCVAHSRVSVNRISTNFEIDFGNIQLGQKVMFLELPASTSIPSAAFAVYMIKQSNAEENIAIEVTFEGKKYVHHYCTCLIHVLSVSGKALAYVKEEYSFKSNENTFIWTFQIPVTKSQILANNRLYLRNDTLNMRCEFAISYYGDFEDVDYTDLKISTLEDIQSIINQSEAHSHEYNKFVSATEGHACPSDLKDNLQCMYRQGIFSDFNVQVDGVSFLTHRCLLSARSEVFKAMLESNMQEAVSNTVEISDLDANIVKKMLDFLYTDQVTGLQWDIACKLYYAANKYELQTLKQICLSYLKSNLSISNAFEVLLLADFYSNTELMMTAQDFICKQDISIIVSEEWKEFEKNYPSKTIELFHVICSKNTSSEESINKE